MRRWVLRILFTLLILLIAAVVAIQVVLWTSLPKRIVLKQLESTLSLRCGARSVSTDWAGDTVLEDVTLSLPLASESFLKVKTLRVKHTNLPALIATRSLTLKRLEFDQPELLITQDSSGQWNVLQAAELVGRAGGGKQAARTAEPKKPEVAQIPEILLKGGAVRVIDKTKRTARIEPLNLTGRPEGALVWRYDVTAGPVESPELHLVGKLVPGGDWRHEVEVTLSNNHEWMDQWISNAKTRRLANEAVVHAQWEGNSTGNGVSGELRLKDVHTGEYSATGAARIEFAGGSVTVRPQQLRVDGVPMIQNVSLTSGDVKFDGATVAATDLIASDADGDLRLNGQFGLADNSGQAQADWNNLQFPRGTTHSGSLKFALHQNWTGRRVVDATLISSGSSSGTSWDGRLRLQGSGNENEAIQWSLTAEKLRVKHDQLDADLNQLTAQFTNTRSELTLTDLHIPSGQLTADRPRGTLAGRGTYHWPTKTSGGDWDLHITGDAWRVFKKRDVTAAFEVAAKGTFHAPNKYDWLHLDTFTAATSDGLHIVADGKASYTAPGVPADLNVHVGFPPVSIESYTSDATLRGKNFHSDLHVTGGANPPRLTVNGTMTGRNVLISDHPVGDLLMALSGNVTGKDWGDFKVHLATDHMQLMRGDWDLVGDYDSNSDQASVDAKLDRLELMAVEQFIKSPPKLKGNISGQWKITLPRLEPKQAVVDGNLKVVDVRAPYFDADQITAHITTNPQKVVVNDIHVTRNRGGEMNASVSFPVAEPTLLSATINVASWPVQLPAATLLVNAQTTEPAVLDFKAKATHAPFTLQVKPTYRGVDCGSIQASGEVADRVIHVTHLDGSGFGGRITGMASYDLDDVLKARASLAWRNLDTVQLAGVLSATPTTAPSTQPAEFSGRISGTATLAPPTDPHPLAPLQLHVETNGEKLVWRAAKIDGATINLFFDPDSPAHERRLVIEGSEVRFAGGKAKVFARSIRRRSTAGTQPVLDTSFTVHVDGENLDLNQLTHTGAKDANNAPGRLSFSASLNGAPFDRKTWVGNGTAQLEKSDLADTGIIGGLYAIMSVKFGQREPIGFGNAAFHFEGDDLRIDSFFFSQRGVEARGGGTVLKVWDIPDSPLDGYVVGTLRPLRDLKLPFAASVDKALSLIQRNITAVKVSGTVRKPKLVQAAFSELGQGIKQFLLNDLFGGK